MKNQLVVRRLLTHKAALGESRIEFVEEDLAPGAPEVVLKINRFAVTTNNITYAAFGESMQYWGFFPTGLPDWGHMPVWGFADVIHSNVPGIEMGERFYGYFPIASHIRMRPERVTERGFYDGAEHRRRLTSAYNQYTRCSHDPVYSPEREELQMLFRPLFITSFMGADFLEDNQFFGARRILVSSASSKTAYGTAFCLGGRKDVEVIALTSAGNRAFVEGLGCYHRVVDYGGVTGLARDTPTLYLDFAGNEALRETVHRHFDGSLTYDCYAGSAQTTGVLRRQDLPGPEPKLYFAPVQIRKRNADWGPQEVNRRFNAAQLALYETVTNPANPWVQVVEVRGFEAARRLIADLLAGRTEPRLGHVVRLP